MKGKAQILVLLLAITMVVPAGMVRLAIHFPDLIVHYYQHQQQEELSISSFITDHLYAVHHDTANSHEHDFPPISSSFFCDGSQICASLPLHIEQHFSVFFADYLTLAYPSALDMPLSGAGEMIWQPPKQG